MMIILSVVTLTVDSELNYHYNQFCTLNTEYYYYSYTCLALQQLKISSGSLPSNDSFGESFVYYPSRFLQWIASWLVSSMCKIQTHSIIDHSAYLHVNFIILSLRALIHGWVNLNFTQATNLQSTVQNTLYLLYMPCQNLY